MKSNDLLFLVKRLMNFPKFSERITNKNYSQQLLLLRNESFPLSVYCSHSLTLLRNFKALFDCFAYSVITPSFILSHSLDDRRAIVRVWNDWEEPLRANGRKNNSLRLAILVKIFILSLNTTSFFFSLVYFVHSLLRCDFNSISLCFCIGSSNLDLLFFVSLSLSLARSIDVLETGKLFWTFNVCSVLL